MRRNPFAVALPVLVFAMTVHVAMASPVILNSNSTAVDPRQTNNQTYNNVVITPHGVWNANGLDAFGNPYYWISYGQTGVGGGITPDDASGTITLPNPEAATASFYLSFTLTSAATDGALNVWADDTARVYLDGILLIDANPNFGSACSAGPIGCTTENGAHFDLGDLHLGAGAHTIQIDAYQRGGDVFGVQYNGYLNQVPEPATFTLIGGGLIALGVIVHRKRRSASKG